MTISKVVFAGLTAVSALIATVSVAQDYPVKPVRLIVTFPPGGGADMLARALGKQLGERWKNSVVIDNRGGGDGAIGAAVAVKTPPDGYTLLMVISTHTVLPHIKRSLQYDITQDFTPVVRVAEAPNIVVTHPSLPARNIPELIALAKKNPGQLDYPGSGYGGPAHLAGVLFDQFAGTKLNFIPYKGAGPSLVALMGGHVTLMFPAITGALPHVRSGKIRALAVTSEKRYVEMPDLPTVGETLKGYAFVGWYGLVSRTGTPAAIVDKVHADTVAALDSKELRDFLRLGGLTAAVLNPAAFGTFIGGEIKQAAKLVASAGLTKD
ncbi:MAG: tripartite tricarboxylate transporter substrate binding protein [Burkholderiales bacterium]|nr:tripartite tricarboxylate transporter substrate binding protein [Burkholderiales bacterium]